MHKSPVGEPRPPRPSVAEMVEMSRRPVADRQGKARQQEIRSHIHYMGFRITEAGREYTLCAAGAAPRYFVMVIGHGHFASGQARYQDGPDVCCAKLTRVLAETASEEEPTGPYVLTGEELLEYRAGRNVPRPTRKRDRSGDQDG